MLWYALIFGRLECPLIWGSVVNAKDSSSYIVAAFMTFIIIVGTLILGTALFGLFGLLIKDRWEADPPLKLEPFIANSSGRSVFVGKKSSSEGLIYSYATRLASGSFLPVKLKPIKWNDENKNVHIYQEPRKDGELIIYRSKPAISCWWLIGYYPESESYAFHTPEGAYYSE